MTDGLGIFCYLASLFSSGSVAGLGLGELVSGWNTSGETKPEVNKLLPAGNGLFSLRADDFFCLQGWTNLRMNLRIPLVSFLT